MRKPFRNPHKEALRFLNLNKKVNADSVDTNVRNDQVDRLVSLLTDKETAVWLDDEAYQAAGLNTNWGARANGLLEAGLRNSTTGEIRTAQKLWMERE